MFASFKEYPYTQTFYFISIDLTYLDIFSRGYLANFDLNNLIRPLHEQHNSRVALPLLECTIPKLQLHSRTDHFVNSAQVHNSTTHSQYFILAPYFSAVIGARTLE